MTAFTHALSNGYHAMVKSLTRELHSEDGRDHEKTGKKASPGFGGGSGMVQSRAGFGRMNTGWEEGGREGLRWRGQKTGAQRCALREDCSDLLTAHLPSLSLLKTHCNPRRVSSHSSLHCSKLPGDGDGTFGGSTPQGAGSVGICWRNARHPWWGASSGRTATPDA